MSDGKLEDRTTWATGGGTLLGIGVGFFFLEYSVFAFVGCILAGIGLGLLVTSVLAARSRATGGPA